MLKSRRKFISKILSMGAYSLSIASGVLHSPLANALKLKPIFALNDYDKTIKQLFNGAKLIDNHHKIQLYRLPKVAENGAIVPIKVISTFKKITKMYILVEENPHPLSIEFSISPSVKAHVSARLKMAKTSNVVVIVEADGKFYRKTKKVNVVKGGCGG